MSVAEHNLLYYTTQSATEILNEKPTFRCQTATSSGLEKHTVCGKAQLNKKARCNSLYIMSFGRMPT